MKFPLGCWKEMADRIDGRAPGITSGAEGPQELLKPRCTMWKPKRPENAGCTGPVICLIAPRDRRADKQSCGGHRNGTWRLVLTGYASQLIEREESARPAQPFIGG